VATVRAIRYRQPVCAQAALPVGIRRVTELPAHRPMDASERGADGTDADA
jgi:hypothetical protein